MLLRSATEVAGGLGFPEGPLVLPGMRHTTRAGLWRLETTLSGLPL